MSDFKKEISDRVDLYASDRNLIGSASLFMIFCADDAILLTVLRIRI